MIRRILLWLVFSLPLGLVAQAQTAPAVPEYTMKAAYIYNFALLTTWPASSSNTFNLCLYGQDSFGPALDALNGKEVSGQKIQVRRIEHIEDALQCRLIFISETSNARVALLVNTIGRAPILTVADDGLPWTSGAMISLAPENRRLVFEVNAAATKLANLQLSSKLLRLASRVVSP